ncbi:TVP38/TMEM64 family protein [Haloplanus sp. GCM10025708]|uniref:TVP38/TMEM64 family protein n=1 Tax=Haloferacaceae TaxID=1644056 RepID=UPI003616B2B0
MDRRRRLAVSSALVGAIAALGWVVSPDAALSRLSWIAADPLRLAVALCVLALVRPLFAWPTTLIAVAAGYGFGLAAIPFALALIVLTSVPPFLFAHRLRDGRLASIGERFVDETGDLRGVTASRLMPAPSDVVSAGAGVAGVSPGAFVVGTAIGELPWAVAGVVAGDSLGALTAGALGDAIDVRLVAVAGIAAVVLLAAPVYRQTNSSLFE